ncbi:MAG: tRNA preQ1(34) S-adenosylmethionine ribosyltransferase-isomerase QueA [Deltaproteobacteria bacterium]|nr:MAG: tRNA preQ1(34) S-adenosylmethionine ribosyltransferase-isomerase QueA [Deltaproteobacteria bacterium]
MYLLSDYDYTLPPEMVAQAPSPRRDQSRLMVLDRGKNKITDRRFSDITGLLHSGDLLVINNTRVVPARLKGVKETGGKVEVLLLDYPHHIQGEQDTGRFSCRCLVKASKRPRTGSRIFFDKGLSAKVLEAADGIFKLEFRFAGNFDTILQSIGEIPLPPYIKRNGPGSAPCDDRQRYQTVYADRAGAIAAPTAGLHFTEELISRLVENGVEVVPITLHVGYGTFLPVRVTDIRQHQMHPETYTITDEAAAVINRAKCMGRRVIAVGTTVVRALESAAEADGRIRAESSESDLFIYPGFRFKVIDALITNFHLPKSTLLMLVCAFASRCFVFQAYEDAIRRKYRFFSYGDAMLIL